MNRRYEDIKMMESILDSNQKIDAQLILKSSLMLMIYNMVEGTMSNLLKEYFDRIHSKNISISSLPNDFQHTIQSYLDKKHSKNNNEEDSVDTIFELSYTELTKYLKLFSGNLDSRSIREVSKKLGVDLPSSVMEPVLLTVKNKRNKLAHGDTIFNNACQDIPLKDLKEIGAKTHNFLQEVIDAYERCLNNMPTAN
ncbi:MAG: MAE_28990/MAE_18760 family HEPN-like nuclease [Lachnospiraceae bacterium]